ncbi:MAG TPA: alpha/beta fold hydrolase [Desulfuromonadales bacterium]|jgi:carboxylesterase
MTIEEEVNRGRRDGVVREENLPFLLHPARPAKAGVLLVHGFTASPWEMRLFGEALAAEGYLALGVRLPGHGTTAEDLVHRSYEEWQTAVERGYRQLAEQGLRCYGIGMSTGALLVLLLAASRPLQGLVLLSPFLKLRHPLSPATGLLRFFKRFQHREVTENLAAYYYDRRPVNGVYQLCRLTRRIRKVLGSVTTPALVVSSTGDQTVEPESARELFRQLASRHKEYHCFGPDVPHILTTPENPRWRETFRLTLDFLQSLEQPEGTARRVAGKAL